MQGSTAQEPKGATIVVTGAGSGIGYAVTRRLLEAGYVISAWDVTEGKLSGVNDAGLEFHQIDVRDKPAMDQVVTGIKTPIAGLVNCAAIYKPVPFLELDEASWDAHLNINLKGTLFASQSVLPRMRAQKSGAIVMFSSGIARTGARHGTAYAATKGGVLGLARGMALDVSTDNIRVNVISPGVTDTPQPRGHRSQADLDAMAAAHPMGRIGEPEDMAETTLFLLEDDASFITGQDIRVNGGGMMI